MTAVTRPSVVPVILAGTAGTRSWPLARHKNPKQFRSLASGLSLFQDTVRRACRATGADPVVVCKVEHRPVVEEQMAQLQVTPALIVCEPSDRDTGPAIAAAATAMGEIDVEATLLVLPLDHAIGDGDEFTRDIQAAVPAASAAHLVTFGITPSSAHTGFGYIRQGPALVGVSGVYVAEEFVEKPDLARAHAYFDEGTWLWNSGVSLLPLKVLLDEFAVHEPSAATAVASAVELAVREDHALLLDYESFGRAPSISLDDAVMERTSRAAVLPTTLDGSDAGCWSSMWSIRDQAPDGNLEPGNVLVEDVASSYGHSDGRSVTAVGLTDLTVVSGRDAVLVADRDHSQDVGDVVRRLVELEGAGAADCPLVRRPWGTYESIDQGRRHQVKHITVKPGHKLSLQRHQHRAEHWVVVSGSARVVRGDEVLTLRENDSLHVPAGCVHRVENSGDEPLHFIEVQVGDYLGEDDIERLADDYGRS